MIKQPDIVTAVTGISGIRECMIRSKYRTILAATVGASDVIAATLITFAFGPTLGLISIGVMVLTELPSFARIK